MKYALAFIAALAFPAMPALAQHFEIGPGGVHVGPGHEEHHGWDHEHHWGGGECRRLLWRCEHKEALGEEGMGNCQRYRHECE